MIFTDLLTGALSGECIATSTKRVADLEGYWQDGARGRGDNRILYTTQTLTVAGEEKEGSVLWGNTVLMPGTVGDEFFMTRGHRHVKKTHGELCVTISGAGLLLLMDEGRVTRSEEMSPGSTHWIAGDLAHRTVNTGSEPLVFLCAWPGDCGHDYAEIAALGFSARVVLDAGAIRILSV